MYKLSVSKLETGMLVAHNVYNVQGTCLLSKGTVLDNYYIKRLHELEIYSLYVAFSKEELDLDISPIEIVKETTRTEAVKSVFDVFERFKCTDSLDMRLLKRASASIINDLRQNEYNIVQLNDVRLYDKYTFNHSVNVSILATMVGIDLGYNEQQLDDLSIGALMHDVGKMKVSRNILNKPSHLDPGEMAEMSKHPTYGLELLDTSPVTMSETARQIVVQHHERFDGTGYPKKLCGKEISEMARIVSIADVYDALTSDRPYKCAYMPSVAYKMMNGVLARGFDPDLLKIFLRHIAFYPQGSVVRMKNGDYAIVRALNGDDLSKPQVEIIADSSYKLYEPHKFMDLREYEDGKIDSVLNEMESMRVYLLLNRKR